MPWLPTNRCWCVAVGAVARIAYYRQGLFSKIKNILRRAVVLT